MKTGCVSETMDRLPVLIPVPMGWEATTPSTPSQANAMVYRPNNGLRECERNNRRVRERNGTRLPNHVVPEMNFFFPNTFVIFEPARAGITPSCPTCSSARLTLCILVRPM